MRSMRPGAFAGSSFDGVAVREAVRHDQVDDVVRPESLEAARRAAAAAHTVNGRRRAAGAVRSVKRVRARRRARRES